MERQSGMQRVGVRALFDRGQRLGVVRRINERRGTPAVILRRRVNSFAESDSPLAF